MTQFKADDRFKYALSAPSALDEMCHPIGKLKAMGEIISALNRDMGDRPFPDISTEAVESIGGIIEDAVEDLKLLLDVACEQANSVRSDLQLAATELLKYRKKERQGEMA